MHSVFNNYLLQKSYMFRRLLITLREFITYAKGTINKLDTVVRVVLRINTSRLKELKDCKIQGGSNMTGNEFFFFVTIIAHHSSKSQTGLNRF